MGCQEFRWAGRDLAKWLQKMLLRFQRRRGKNHRTARQKKGNPRLKNTHLIANCVFFNAILKILEWTISNTRYRYNSSILEYYRGLQKNDQKTSIAETKLFSYIMRLKAHNSVLSSVNGASWMWVSIFLTKIHENL